MIRPVFDFTIHLSDLVIVGGLVVAFFKIFLGLRDAIRDLTSAMKTMRVEVDDHETRLRGIEWRRRTSDK